MCSVPYYVELLLEFLVGIVDAKLLKRVVTENLKAVDIQNPNEGLRMSVRASETLIDPFHNPLEEMIIQMTRETVPTANSLTEKNKE